MFCPNCAKSNPENVKYCRSCGIGLEKVSDLLRLEQVKLENESGFFNERLFGRLGTGFLYAFLAVGFGFIFTLAVYYKFKIFGAETMGYFGIFGFVLLGVLSAVFFGVKKHLANKRGLFDIRSDAGTAQLDGNMSRLDAGSMETAADMTSVTENTTELLDAKVPR